MQLKTEKGSTSIRFSLEILLPEIEIISVKNQIIIRTCTPLNSESNRWEANSKEGLIEKSRYFTFKLLVLLIF